MTTPMELFDESLRLHAEAVDAAAANDGAPTPCSDYTVLDLINHCILTLRSFSAPLDGGPTASMPEIIAADDVTGGDPVGETKREIERAHAAYVDADLSQEREYNLGVIPVGQALAVLTMQNVVHAWDLQQATGGTITPSEELLTLVENVAAQLIGNVPPGLFAAPVEASGADRLAKLLALTGRSA